MCSCVADVLRNAAEFRISGLVFLLLGQLPAKFAQEVLVRLPFTREGRFNARLKYLMAEAGTIARCRSTDPEAEQRNDLMSMLRRCGRKEDGGSRGVREIVALIVWEQCEGMRGRATV